MTHATQLFVTYAARSAYLPPLPTGPGTTGLGPWMAVAAAVVLLLGAPAARAACAEGLSTLSASATPSGDASAPRIGLLGLIDAANQRSKAVGAAKLLADAARSDLAETQAGSLPTATLNATAGPAGSQGMDGRSTSSGFVLRPSVVVAAPLYDSGRQGHLNRWRESLSEAARLGQLSTQEQIALQTVTLSFDRSRYRLHTQVWSQYAQKVCGLVDALEQIAAADRGRRSELVQARKQLQQVLLSRAQALSQLRLTEARLRRLVGDDLPEATGLSAVMLEAPDLRRLQAQASDAPTIAQLEAQAQAASSLADATSAGQKPQAGWMVSASKSISNNDKSGVWNAGVTFSVPLFNASHAPAGSAARQRAEAARLQRLDALEALQSRLAEVHEQASASLTRAKDVSGVLRSSEQVRDDTTAQWQQLGRRSLFDVISAEGDHFNLRLAYVDALHDGQQAVALLWSLASGVTTPLK